MLQRCAALCVSTDGHHSNVFGVMSKSMAGNVSASSLRGVERRTRILDAALELFAEQGFILTSLPMIAERVGITHAGILHHFGSKEGVLRALLDR